MQMKFMEIEANSSEYIDLHIVHEIDYISLPSQLIIGLQEMGRLSPPESVTGFSIKFIGDWTVLQIMSGDLGQLGLTQNNCSLYSFL